MVSLKALCFQFTRISAEKRHFILQKEKKEKLLFNFFHISVKPRLYGETLSR